MIHSVKGWSSIVEQYALEDCYDLTIQDSITKVAQMFGSFTNISSISENSLAYNVGLHASISMNKLLGKGGKTGVGSKKITPGSFEIGVKFNHEMKTAVNVLENSFIAGAILEDVEASDFNLNDKGTLIYDEDTSPHKVNFLKLCGDFLPKKYISGGGLVVASLKYIFKSEEDKKQLEKSLGFSIKKIVDINVLFGLLTKNKEIDVKVEGELSVFGGNGSILAEYMSGISCNTTNAGVCEDYMNNLNSKVAEYISSIRSDNAVDLSYALLDYDPTNSRYHSYQKASQVAHINISDIVSSRVLECRKEISIFADTVLLHSVKLSNINSALSNPLMRYSLEVTNKIHKAYQDISDDFTFLFGKGIGGGMVTRAYTELDACDNVKDSILKGLKFDIENINFYSSSIAHYYKNILCSEISNNGDGNYMLSTISKCKISSSGISHNLKDESIDQVVGDKSIMPASLYMIAHCKDKFQVLISAKDFKEGVDDNLTTATVYRVTYKITASSDSLILEKGGDLFDISGGGTWDWLKSSATNIFKELSNDFVDSDLIIDVKSYDNSELAMFGKNPVFDDIYSTKEFDSGDYSSELCSEGLISSAFVLLVAATVL